MDKVDGLGKASRSTAAANFNAHVQSRREEKTLKILEIETVVDKEDCEIWLYEGLSLPKVMPQGWFNDQHDCFELFVSHLNSDELAHLFTDERHFESAKATYKEFWNKGHFNRVAKTGSGEHRRLNHLVFSSRRCRASRFGPSVCSMPSPRQAT